MGANKPWQRSCLPCLVHGNEAGRDWIDYICPSKYNKLPRPYLYVKGCPGRYHPSPPLHEAITPVVNHQTDGPVTGGISALPKRPESQPKTGPTYSTAPSGAYGMLGCAVDTYNY